MEERTTEITIRLFREEITAKPHYAPENADPEATYTVNLVTRQHNLGAVSFVPLSEIPDVAAEMIRRYLEAIHR